MGLSTLKDEQDSYHYIDGWSRFFALIPRRSQSGRRIWLEFAYRSRYSSIRGEAWHYLKLDEVEIKEI